MTDLDPDLPDLSDSTDPERELWAATLTHLREHAEDPRAEQGLDRLAARILAEHRANPPVVLPRRRTGGIVIGAGLATAATLAVIVLATRPEDNAIHGDANVGDESVGEHDSAEPGPDPQSEPQRSGPPLEQTGLLTLGVGRVEQTTEIATVIEPGTRVEPGATLSTAHGGETCLRWTAPFALVCVEGEAQVELLAAEPSARRLRLHQGRLIAVLDPLVPGQRFEVETRLGEVVAVGTVFVVEVGAVGITASVVEGEVEVRADGGIRRLRANQSVELGASPVGSPTNELRMRAETLTARAELWREPLDRMGSVAWTSARAVELDGHPLASGSLTLLLTAGQHRLHADDLDLDLDFTISADNREALGELAKAKQLEPAPAEQSAAELARLAQQARMARNYAETTRLYRELIDRYPDSPEATNAPVRLGDLLRKTGDQLGALAVYDLYLERGGPLEPEARFGRIKALRSLARPPAEREAIAEFLREHPDDYRVDELRERQAELE